MRKNHPVTIKLSEKEYDNLKLLSRHFDMSMGEVIRSKLAELSFLDLLQKLTMPVEKKEGM